MGSFASSVKPLAASGDPDNGDEVIVGPIQTGTNTNICGTIFADQDGTIYIEQTFDGTNFDLSASYDITGGEGQGFNEPIIAPVAQVRFVNTTASPQDTFRLYVRAFGVRGT